MQRYLINWYFTETENQTRRLYFLYNCRDGTDFYIILSYSTNSREEILFSICQFFSKSVGARMKMRCVMVIEWLEMMYFRL